MQSQIAMQVVDGVLWAGPRVCGLEKGHVGAGQHDMASVEDVEW